MRTMSNSKCNDLTTETTKNDLATYTDDGERELDDISTVVYLGREQGYVRIKDQSYYGIDVNDEDCDCEPYEGY